MKTYYVMVAGNYVDQITTDGYGTTADEQDAAVLYYNEAADLCYRINRNAGKVDEAVMVEAIEKDEYEEEEELDEHARRAEIQAEMADDLMDLIKSNRE
jgi:hypothetical protein